MSQQTANRISQIKTDDKIITVSFCESFKDRLVEFIQKEYLDKDADLSRLAIVFGGRRPSLFVKRDLARLFDKSFHPPRFFTIDDFVQYTLSQGEEFNATGDLDNCYLLYKLAKKEAPHILKGRETFAQFLPWVREILKFIDHLDLENINDKALNTIQANAQIGYDVPDDINQLLESIVKLRQAYHRELGEQKIYSRGLQYLRAAQLVDNHDFAEFDQILFCNFFYFHRTEEKIVKSLYERDKATLIFQGDSRKWPVLKRISGMFAHPIEEGKEPQVPQFRMNMHAGFDIHSQAGLVREILKKIDQKENTVIVLPDPGHIIPLLSEIGSSIEHYNVSMGYPLKRSSLYTLFEFIFRAQLSAKDGRYYTKDYLKALSHPFVKNLKLSQNAAVTRILVHKIEEVLTGKERTVLSGSLFVDLPDIVKSDDIYELARDMLKRLGYAVDKKELKKILQTIHELVFTQWEAIGDFRGFSSTLEQFLDVFVEKSFMRNYPINLNIATKIYAIKDEFLEASFSKERFEKEEMFRIFEQKMDHEFIKFEGSPLKGLQILGLLETRSLNFDHVIVMDVNEGVLPSLRVHEPLIPREVMISLGLDRLELEEEIQRYQFMRLISSANNVHLVYQEGKDKERSRFVEELIWEEQKKKRNLSAAAVIRPSFRVSVASNKRTVAKTPAMIQFLKNHTYSASSINMYLRNPMEFYTNYVLGLRAHEDLLDEPDARHVGTFVHELLHEAFKPFVGKKPKIDQVFANKFMKTFDELFEQTFARQMKSDSFLLRSVMEERLSRFITHEQTSDERRVEKILYLENRFENVLHLPVGNIKFNYVVDRIDKLADGTIMIVDYKTGNIDQMPRALGRIASMELSRENILEHVKSLQIPLYFHYLDKEYPDDPINAALYSLKTLKMSKFIDAKLAQDRGAINGIFLNVLNFILAEILNPDIPFEEDTNHSLF